MNKRDRMYQRIEKHGEDVKRIFGIEGDPVKLSKKLRSLEVQANRVMVQYCNGEIDYDKTEEYILKTLKPRLVKILGEEGARLVYVNHDPRGYTLKINELTSKSVSIHKDWGGYGILAPDFRED